MANVDVVIPVHGALASLRRCVDSVFAARCRTPFEVVIVDDGNADAELAQYLADLQRRHRVARVTQPARQGYAAAVNRALSLHRDRDVVVLQSDAEVANDWLDRLVRHAAAPDVGLVGCFTDNVGAATYPLQGRSNPLPAGHTAATLDALFARANAGCSAKLPALSGPCLYLRRECLNVVGAFDANPLGSDYGVEIDFCLRAGSAGFRHLLAGDVFVAHEGGMSFGATEADALAQRANAALAKLYPAYVAQQEDLANRAPGRPFARRVDLLRLAESQRRPLVFVSHPWGGGIRRYMNDLVELTEAHCNVLFLEPAVGDTVKLSWPREDESFALYFSLPAELSVLAETLRTIGVERLHFHHVHLHPRAILELPALLGVAYDYTLHDYHPICPQYHLVTEDGHYCGEPDAKGCAACLARRPAQWDLDIGAWRGAFGRLLRGASRVIAPSQDVATRMQRYFPDLAVEVWPHPEALPLPTPRITRVGILGNLSPEKGLQVVAACAGDARARGLPLSFRVLGSTTEPIPQAPDTPLTIYGQYVDSELQQLIAAEKPDVLLFAAQVPETYAYTLSVALQSGLPIVASALGALPERLAGVPHSTTVPWNAPPAVWNDALLAATDPTPRVSDRAPPRARVIV
ncbi:MAG: glycosyltransferase [Burkholderiales bacterium]|nr:glycosyltransferase [Burkholderiales bacterium]